MGDSAIKPAGHPTVRLAPGLSCKEDFDPIPSRSAIPFLGVHHCFSSVYFNTISLCLFMSADFFLGQTVTGFVAAQNANNSLHFNCGVDKTCSVDTMYSFVCKKGSSATHARTSANLRDTLTKKQQGRYKARRWKGFLVWGRVFKFGFRNRPSGVIQFCNSHCW